MPKGGVALEKHVLILEILATTECQLRYGEKGKTAGMVFGGLWRLREPKRTVALGGHFLILEILATAEH